MNVISLIAAVGCLLSGGMMGYAYNRGKQREMLLWAALWAVLVVLNAMVAFRSLVR